MTFWDKLGSADSKLTKKSTSFIKARNKLFENPMFFRYVLQNVQIRFDIVTMYPEAISICTAVIMKLLLIRARSERGSRRLPRERSSEISKNCHKNYLCKFPNIHPRENKSGRQIWAFFVGFSYAL